MSAANPRERRSTQPSATLSRKYRSRRLAALTSSLALKAHCAFNLKQAQRYEVKSPQVRA
ncbi:hypothetical protein [Gardnerella sp. DNF00109]|uniref:hypothetical protein n=1 Tax=Gardnerella sp. DNF00109 TaxID=2749042 RepID=UPI003BB041CF